MWIFGYGALMYKADFEYDEKLIGRVRDYNRRFYQQSVYDRGTEDTPGLIATLVPSKGADAWGVAYKLKQASENSIIKKLNGPGGDGFLQVTLKFYPKKSQTPNTKKGEDSGASKQEKQRMQMQEQQQRLSIYEKKGEKVYKKLMKDRASADVTDSSKQNVIASSVERRQNFRKPNKEGFNPLQAKEFQRASNADAGSSVKVNLSAAKVMETESIGDFINVVCYVAPSDNFLFSSTEDLNAIAGQIAKAKGKMGTNVEYILNMAHAFRSLYPQSDDDHLFVVEKKVLEIIGPSHKNEAMKIKNPDSLYIER